MNRGYVNCFWSWYVEFVLKRYTIFNQKENLKMSIPNKDEVEGKFDQLKGKVKEGVGDLTDNESLEAEGEADQVSGETQETWGKFKRGVGDTIDDVADAVRKA